MMVEVSGNYSIVLPVMIANGIAYGISRRFQPVPIFEVLSAQDGVHLPSMEEERESRPSRVEDAMRQAPPVLVAADTIAGARARLDGATAHVPLALPAGRWSIVAAADLARLDESGRGAEALAVALEHAQVPAVHRDQPLDSALRLIGNRPFLPVVHRADPSRLEGVLTLDDILQEYGRARGTPIDDGRIRGS
jgi:CIC family chloride channel protein